MSRTRVEKLQKLLPTEVTGIANILEGKNAVADKNLKEHLPLIKCECEAEILLLPDVQAMNLAIKAHVNEHRQKERNAKRNVITSINISQLLSQLSLRKISEQSSFSILIEER
jgi:hypothetical protein